MVVELSPADVERDATVLSIDKVAVYLQETLGQRVTAYLSGLNDPKMVGRWAAARHQPKDLLTQTRLRHGYQAARLLTGAFDARTAQTWFFGTNSRLGNEAPAYVLRHAASLDDLRGVVPAAIAFVGISA